MYNVKNTQNLVATASNDHTRQPTQSNVSLDYTAICTLAHVSLVCSLDAAFGVRRNGVSQGGHILMSIPDGIFKGEPNRQIDVDHLLVFCSHMLDPGKPLADLRVISRRHSWKQPGRQESRLGD